MTDPRSYLDDTGSYFASIISKNGRNEVQIYPINKDNSSDIISSASVVKIELEADDSILDACWINKGLKDSLSVSSKKRGKRRQSETEIQDFSSSLVYLAISVVSGDILIISPFKDVIVDRISVETNLLKLSGSVAQDSVWGINNASIISEVSLTSSKIVKSFEFPEDKNLELIKIIKYNEKNSKSNKPEYAILASNNLYFVDLSKTPKKALICKFVDDKIQSQVTGIQQSIQDSDIFYATRRDDNKIYVHNFSDPKYLLSLKATSTIHSFRVIFNKGKEIIVAVTGNGLEIFRIGSTLDEVDVSAACLIRTSHHDSEKVLFLNTFLKDEKLIGVWYDINEPNFSLCGWNFDTVGEIEVPIKYSEKVNDSLEEAHNKLSIPKSIKINNLSSTNLYNNLSELLVTPKVDQEKILELCSTNDDEYNIKESIKLFSLSSENSAISINKLFKIISSKVALDPSKSEALSIWLKWLLLAHGGSIAKQPENYSDLKRLQEGLFEGLKLIPVLLGIQGRLHLLKAQAELRDRIASNHENEDSDEENVDITNYDSVAGDSFYYANGENDDFDNMEDNEILINGDEPSETDDEKKLDGTEENEKEGESFE